MALSIIPLTATYYPAFYHLVQSSRWGNLMLPKNYQSSLWGDILIDEQQQVLGGWVGQLRGNNRLTRFFTKSVYFDSFPIFAQDDLQTEQLPSLLSHIRTRARKEYIVMLNLTHWVRGENPFPLDIAEPNATFLYDLSLPMELLHKKLNSSKKQELKKAQKSDLQFQVYQGEQAILHIAELQALRNATQKRAIAHNVKASMLLKSDAFFQQLFENQITSMVATYWNDKMVAAATFIQGGQTVYIHMAGSDSEANRATGAGTYYYWKAIEYFQAQGLRYFDFGGCPVDPTPEDPAYGVYLFKQGFHGDYLQNNRGVLVIAPWRYKVLRCLLSQRKLIRFFSKKL